MKNFARSLTVKWRLIIFVCFLLLLIIGAGSGGLYGMRAVNQSLSDVYKHQVLSFEELREIDHIFESDIVNTVDKTLFGQISWNSGLQTIKKSKKALDERWTNLFSTSEEKNKAPSDSWLAAGRDLTTKSNETISNLIEFFENKDQEGLDAFTDKTLYPLAGLYRETINSLIQERLQTVKKTYEYSQERFDLSKKAFLITIVVGIIISIIASYVLVTSIDVPLNKIIQAMKQVIQGDLTQHLEFGRHDEFGLLIKGFNQMVTYLRELVAQIQQSGIQVTSSITELAATNKQQEVTANQHAATTSEIAASTTEIAATGAHLLTTMKKLNSITKNAAFAAEEGQENLRGLDDTMVKMEEATGSIVTKLQILNDKASNIAGVVKTINKVADQTNLLSLNAAIEAEKAGEYGSGFAVVATEIRRLADQTAVATFDIAQMVKEVQSAISTAVMGIDKFAEDAHTSVKDVNLISEQLSGVIEQVEVIKPQVETLTEGIEAQTLGAKQISEAIGQLNEAAQHTAESLTQTSSSISQLHHAALGLQEGAARFKVETDNEDVTPPV
ncbi:MAG: methyl-accepting chemotaxis protein [Deltaproteobacteria bacterium]|jgi:methyl-accepting chemotaxis protein WspA|nr:methyl-accepting chemotaxis protein [Deltaproteobacteria bacterium]